ncbi:hypothetical protein PQU92_08085 [Asticcacaulis sp. BYS171W]|uniref:Methyltransferase n=1 Tax=Asticcacaulis aquaticus TaxID=2984212 RepID=A0ABT5HT38_9CAUL|nr:hypothetical protein [Asticcacaulis aquaticus]MDC7683233.1 hypothetical protein [Asticcacaulis aquaticus]
MARSTAGRAVSEQHRPAPIDGHQTDLLIDMDKANELQLFPTHPWTVRAVWEILGPLIFPDTWPDVPQDLDIYDPCAGLGHMVEPLREIFPRVFASDVHDWGKGYPVADALFFAAGKGRRNIAFMNPPFDKPLKGMAARMIRQAQHSCEHVIALCRLSFLSTIDRYHLHHDNELGNLRHVLIVTERAPMQLGLYNPKCSKPQEYAYFHYQRGFKGYPQIIGIPKGSRARHFRPEDVRI